MSRRPYVHLAGEKSFWPLGFAPQPSHLRALDQFSSELVNGEDGGEWAPTSPIVLGPSGPSPNIELTTSGSVLSGDVETVAGNELGTEIETPGLILQSGAFPTFQTARTRDIVIPMSQGVVSRDYSASGPEYDLLGIDPETGAYRTRYTPGTSITITMPLPVRAQHRGATIASVDFLFRIDTNFRTLPSAGAGLPQFRVARSTAFTLAALHTNAGGYDSNGWLPDPAASLAAFVNAGNVRTVTYTPDQYNTSLDPGASWFMAQVRDLPYAQWIAVVVHLTAIADYRQE